MQEFSRNAFALHRPAVRQAPAGARMKCSECVSMTQKHSSCCTGSCEVVHVGIHDGSAEERWGREPFGGEDVGSPVRPCCRSHLLPIPICTLHQRVGTDCVGHAVQFATDANPEATVLSIDGVGAHDHVYRSAMMEKLLQVLSLQDLLPFVRSTHLQPSCCKWVDSEGVRHDIQQHEGGEQGDPHALPLQSRHPRCIGGSQGAW